MTYSSLAALVACLIFLAAFAVSMKRLERLAEQLEGPLFWPAVRTLVFMLAALFSGAAV